MNENEQGGAVVLVTGGTKGIGRAVSRAFAAAGDRVAAWYRADDAAAEALRAESESISTARVDVADPEAVAAAVEALVAAEGRIDTVVNAAGIAHDALFAAMAPEDWSRVLRVNLDGTMHVCRAVVREMIFRRAGWIVNVASLSGVTGLPGQTHYAASKAGVIAFTKSLAQELARYGILVNAVSPGLVETGLTATMREARRAALLARIPLGRFGRPEEVAALVRFLGSAANTYITGQNYVIAGGLYT